MARTLIEAAKSAKTELARAVIEIYARTTGVMQALPFVDIQGNALKYDIESSLPGVGFRGVNEGFTESQGVMNPVYEPLVIAGGDIDVDRFITVTMGADQRTNQEVMKIKALAHLWTNTFFKGDSEASPKQFDGLQRRLTGNQLLANGSTSGGDALSLAKLDEAIDKVDDPTHLCMSKAMKRLMSAAARNTSVSGYITYSVDSFGKRIMKYNDLPIIVIGENGDFYNTLDFTEANPGGGSSVGTSIYVVSFGPQKIAGIQNGTIDVRDLGELESKPSYRTRLEWFSGLSLWHPRAACRLYGIKNAAVTA